jgi:hypothetical protein
MKFLLTFFIGVFCLSKGIGQNDKIVGESNFTLKFIVANDTISANQEYNLFINGPFPVDNSGHQGGIKENIKVSDREGRFKMNIVNPGEYEFTVVGKGAVKIRIENNAHYDLFVPIE